MHISIVRERRLRGLPRVRTERKNRTLENLRVRQTTAKERLVVAGRGTGDGYHCFLLVAAFTHPLPAFGAELQERSGLVVEALALVRIPERVLDDAPHNFRAEVVLVVKAIHAAHHFGLAEVRILDVRKLVTAGV